jgi:hypothetical protein
MSAPRQIAARMLGHADAHGRRLVLIALSPPNRLEIHVEVNAGIRDSSKFVARLSRSEATALIELLRRGLDARGDTDTITSNPKA